MISGCILSNGVSVESGTKMSGCQVAPNFKVEEGDHKDEQMAAGEMEL